MVVSSPNISLSFDYPMRSFDEQGRPVYGVLATDRPHQLKAQGVLHLAVRHQRRVLVVRRQRHPADTRGGGTRRTSPSCTEDARATAGCRSCRGSISTPATTCAWELGIPSG